jgi:hypothetical protein
MINCCVFSNNDTKTTMIIIIIIFTITMIDIKNNFCFVGRRHDVTLRSISRMTKKKELFFTNEKKSKNYFSIKKWINFENFLETLFRAGTTSHLGVKNFF